MQNATSVEFISVNVEQCCVITVILRHLHLWMNKDKHQLHLVCLCYKQISLNDYLC